MCLRCRQNSLYRLLPVFEINKAEKYCPTCTIIIYCAATERFLRCWCSNSFLFPIKKKKCSNETQSQNTLTAKQDDVTLSLLFLFRMNKRQLQYTFSLMTGALYDQIHTHNIYCVPASSRTDVQTCFNCYCSHKRKGRPSHSLVHLLCASRRLDCQINILAKCQTRPYFFLFTTALKS